MNFTLKLISNLVIAKTIGTTVIVTLFKFSAFLILDQYKDHIMPPKIVYISNWFDYNMVIIKIYMVWLYKVLITKKKSQGE
jgi:hypothetical protein